jgi:Kef-type K+ transport system membrane component KefB
VADGAFVFLRHDHVTLTLLGVAVVLVAARLAGRFFERIGEPPVIGEVIAGLALGPSVLGGYSTALFPLEARPLLTMLATLGLVTFMFLIGLEMNLHHLRGRHRIAGGVALSGTVVPFAFGVLLASALYRSHTTGRFLPFALFLGAAMSITAFPVLVRILRERGLHDKPLGVVATACAAGDDVLTWATLALVVAIVSSSGIWDLPYILGLSIAFAGFLICVVRPRLARYADRAVDNSALSTVVVGLLVCSYATAAIGIHEIFGAFLLGVVFPRGALADGVRDRLQSFAHVLLPVFFVTTGLNVNVGRVGLAGVWQLGLILVVAFGSKILGSMIGARTQGLALRESVALGVIMNTRGLTELVVLNIGRDLGILDPTLFTLLVLMAVITTLATGPLLAAIKPDPYLGLPAGGRARHATRAPLAAGGHLQ